MAVVSKGFTLLELLVTISIIGILMAIGSVSFSTAQKKGRDSRRQADVKAVQKSLEECYSVDTAYPQSLEAGSSITCEAGQTVMNLVPSDPKPEESYTYTVDADPATSYCFCAELENLGTGNASSLGANGVCTMELGGDYFCVSNQQ